MFVPHYEMPVMAAAGAVEYCGVCGLPPDFCKYGPLADKHGPAVAETKQAERGTVLVKIAPRIGKRFLTTVSGLDEFDVDVSKACKVFAKKFACGVGNKDGEIEIQGDVEDAIVETITTNWKQIRSRHIVIKRK